MIGDEEFHEVLPDRVGKINFKTGDVTDEYGEVRTLPQYRDAVRDEDRALFYSFCDARDISSDIQNLPGSKPYFHDDWYYDYPSQLDNKGLYPSEIPEDDYDDGDPAS